MQPVYESDSRRTISKITFSNLVRSSRKKRFLIGFFEEERRTLE
jgi:hypothetical protein